jgi:hypothetical protein
VRLAINDGYTLEAATLSEFSDVAGLPVINFRYRPALPEALAEWRYQVRVAGSGKAEVEATAKLIADHLVSWDVVDARGAVVEPTSANIKRVPEPILDQLVKAIVSWAPKMADSVGNSPTGCGS